MTPTHHYDKNGTPLNEGDSVIAKNRKAIIFWDENIDKWMLNFGSEGCVVLNHYEAKDLEIAK